MLISGVIRPIISALTVVTLLITTYELPSRGSCHMSSFLSHRSPPNTELYWAFGVPYFDIFFLNEPV